MSGSTGAWTVEHRVGPPERLHALPAPESSRRVARFLHVDRSAVVLGSTQRPDVVDAAAAESDEVGVVRRRSGGGAVLMRPDAQVWLDLFVPAGDRLWNADVGVAAWWAGEMWVEALEREGLGGGLVHRLGLQTTEWSSLICFAGLGPGEVSLAGRKVMGLSQRRSRTWTKLQTTAYLAFDPGDLVGRLALTDSARHRATQALDRSASGLAVAGDALVASLTAALPLP